MKIDSSPPREFWNRKVLMSQDAQSQYLDVLARSICEALLDSRPSAVLRPGPDPLLLLHTSSCAVRGRDEALPALAAAVRRRRSLVVTGPSGPAADRHETRSAAACVPLEGRRLATHSISVAAPRAVRTPGAASATGFDSRDSRSSVGQSEQRDHLPGRVCCGEARDACVVVRRGHLHHVASNDVQAAQPPDHGEELTRTDAGDFRRTRAWRVRRVEHVDVDRDVDRRRS